MFTACFGVAPHVSALTVSQVQQEINKLQQASDKLEKEIASLKKDKANQNALKAKLDAQIYNIQQQIALCNGKIEERQELFRKSCLFPSDSGSDCPRG